MKNRTLINRIDNPQSFGHFPIHLCLLVLALLAAAGCQSAGPKAVGSSNDLTSGTIASNLMQLREGDVLRIAFENVTNLNTTVAIPLDGTISLQLIGQIKVSGKTVPELQSSLIALYEPHIKSTEITVTRVSSAASYTVGGAVAKHETRERDHGREQGHSRQFDDHGDRQRGCARDLRGCDDLADVVHTRTRPHAELPRVQPEHRREQGQHRDREGSTQRDERNRSRLF